MSWYKTTLLLIIVAIGILSLFVVQLNGESDSDELAFKSPRAIKAKDDFQAASEKALSDYEERLRLARKKYADALAVAVKTATKAGDFNEAKALQATIDTLAVDKPPEKALPRGAWSAIYSHSHGQWSIVFDGNGGVKAEGLRGQVRKDGEYWILEVEQMNVMRLTANGPRFFVERWLNKADFERGADPSYLAIAHQQKTVP